MKGKKVKIRSVFLTRGERKQVEVGDLIRSTCSPNFVNIVLEVKPKDAGHVYVRSVRFAHCLDSVTKRLNGRRSRWISFPTEIQPWVNFDWNVVEEFVLHHNTQERMDILRSLEGVNTSYVPNEPDSEKEDEDE